MLCHAEEKASRVLESVHVHRQTSALLGYNLRHSLQQRTAQQLKLKTSPLRNLSFGLLFGLLCLFLLQKKRCRQPSVVIIEMAHFEVALLGLGGLTMPNQEQEGQMHPPSN